MASVSGRRPGVGLWRMVAALVRQRRRLALATLAVALSVGYLAGALTLLDRVSAGLANLAAAGAEQADLIVEGEVAYSSSLEETRRLVPSSIATGLEGQPGIAAVIPRLEEVAMILGDDQLPLVRQGLSEQPIGANWPDDDQMSPYRFVGEGAPPVADDEVVIDERSAELAGLEVGDSVLIATKTGVPSFRVTGIVTTAQGDLPAGSTLALFSTARARDLFDMPTNDNRVAIRVDEGADVEQVASQIRQQLPPGSELVDGETGARHRQESLTRGFLLIRVLIMGFAALALIVGMITVANSLTLLYSERRRTFAAFRLVGAKRRQLLGAALVEAALLAGVASLLGAPLGLVLGRVIEVALGSLGTSVPVGGSIVSISALAWAVVVGIVATVLAAIVPARRACAVPVIEAVAESPGADVTSGWSRLVNSVLVVLALAVLVAGLLLLADVALPVVAAIAGGFAAVGVVMVLTPTALSYAVAAGIRLVPTKPIALRRIGSRDAIRNRSRTAATTGALMLATAVVAGLAVFLSSFTASIDSDVSGLVRSDLVVDSQTFTRGGLPGDILERIGALPDVAAVSGWQTGQANIGGRPVRVTGVDGAVLDDVLSPEWVGPAPAQLSETGIAVERGAAEALGLSIGSMVPVVFTSNSEELMSVEGIYDSGSVLLGELILNRSVLTRQVPASYDIVGLVRLTEDTPAARSAVEELAKSYGVTSVLEPSEFVANRSDLLSGFERVIQWMLLFTLVQALVGVVNTLLLSVGERRREFGLLRAAGASRAQVQRLVLIEGGSFAVIGTALGLLAGVVVGVLAIRSLGRFGIEGLAIPFPVLAVTAVAAIALGVLAAVVPARWAAAIPPLDAVADAGESARTGASLSERLTTWRHDRRERSAARSSVAGAATTVATAPPPFTGVVPDLGAAPQSAAPAPQPTAPAPQPATPAPAAPPAVVPVPTPAPAPVAPDEAPPIVLPPIPMHEVTAPVALDPVALEPASVDEPVPAPPVPPAPTFAPGPEPVPVASQPAPTDPGTAPTEPVTAPTPEPDRWIRPATETATPPRRRPNVAFTAAPTRPERTRRTQPEPVLDPVAQLRLGEVLSRLDPASVRDAVPVLLAFAQALEPDEAVHHLAQGWAKGSVCLVASTDRRLVVVVARHPEPLIETLDPTSTAISLYGPPGTDRVSLAVVDGRRLLEVTGIRDSAEAAAMRAAPEPRRRRRPEFF